MGRKGASRHRFALPNPRRTIPPAIFQTVSLERLSGNSERAPLRGLTSLRNRTKGHHLDASRYRKTRDPTRAASFQTVSPETVWKVDCGSDRASLNDAKRPKRCSFAPFSRPVGSRNSADSEFPDMMMAYALRHGDHQIPHGSVRRRMALRPPASSRTRERRTPQAARLEGDPRRRLL